MSSTTLGELSDKTIEKFFKDKKHLSIGMLGGNNSSSSTNGSNDAGYFGSWNSTKDSKNAVGGGGLTSSWTSTNLRESGGQFWYSQNKQKDSFGQKSRKPERKPNFRF